MVYDLDNTTAITITVVRLLAAKHLINNARPRIHVCFRAHRYSTEQFLRRFIAPRIWCRRVLAVRELIHKNVESGVRNANPATFLDQNICRAYIPVVNIVFMQIADSRSDLRDLIQLVGTGAATVMDHNVTPFIVRDYECRQ